MTDSTFKFLRQELLVDYSISFYGIDLAEQIFLRIILIVNVFCFITLVTARHGDICQESPRLVWEQNVGKTTVELVRLLGQWYSRKGPTHVSILE